MVQLIEQLAVGGMLFCPVGAEHGSQSIMVYTRQADGSVVEKRVMGVRYVPLTDAEAQLRNQ